APLVHRARAIADALPAFEVVPDARVKFPALELLEQGKVRVAVIERHDEPEEQLIVSRVIGEAASFGVVVERPAESVNDETLLVPRGVDLPYLLQPKAVMLGIGILAQVEFLHQF